MWMVVQIDVSMRGQVPETLFHHLPGVTTPVHYFWYVHTSIIFFHMHIFIFMTTNSMQNNYNTSRNPLVHPLSIQNIPPPLIPGNH